MKLFVALLILATAAKMGTAQSDCEPVRTLTALYECVGNCGTDVIFETGKCNHLELLWNNCLVRCVNWKDGPKSGDCLDLCDTNGYLKKNANP